MTIWQSKSASSNLQLEPTVTGLGAINTQQRPGGIRASISIVLALMVVVAFSLGGLLEFFGLDSARQEPQLPEGPGPALGAAPPETGPDIPLNLNILVDQFGYRPKDPKTAVIRSARRGFDSGRRFDPGNFYQIRRVDTGETVFEGQPVRWNEGKIDASSGDVGWWLDFSSLRQPGQYYVYDVDRHQRSAVFKVDARVYQPILETAQRMFFLQRSGCKTKKPPFVDPCWADAPAYLGPGQDLEARDIRKMDDPSSARDLSGGWFDAGDTNKYVTFATLPIHQLLSAYQYFPNAFSDDLNIPESGNRIPDILDEVRWGLDWLKKMQNPDGSSLAKVGVTKHGYAPPPSSDTKARYYVGTCTSSTIAAAGSFAHAALVLSGFPQLGAEVIDLRARAIRAWLAYHRTPRKQTNCDDQTVLSGDSDEDLQKQFNRSVMAAVYLFALTGEPRYHDYVREHYDQTRPFKDIGWNRYRPFISDALTFYTRLEQADPDVSASILAHRRQDVQAGNGIYGKSGDDLYRSHLHETQYHWGSNLIRTRYGISNVEALLHAYSPEQNSALHTRALDTLHYLHGVNPFGLVYLTNMYRHGATYSVNEVFHQWFAPETQWHNALTSACGPAPGFLVGGPNAVAVKDGIPEHLEPPAGQPPQKSYRDWNSRWPLHSYQITEPSTNYQASYIRLLAAFAAPTPY